MAERNIVAIVQARMGSTRLPGKVLADIAGRLMLWHVVHRVRQASTLGQVRGDVHRSNGDAVGGFCRAL